MTPRSFQSHFICCFSLYLVVLEALVDNARGEGETQEVTASLSNKQCWGDSGLDRRTDQEHQTSFKRSFKEANRNEK